MYSNFYSLCNQFGFCAAIGSIQFDSQVQTNGSHTNKRFCLAVFRINHFGVYKWTLSCFINKTVKIWNLKNLLRNARILKPVVIECSVYFFLSFEIVSDKRSHYDALLLNWPVNLMSFIIFSAQMGEFFVYSPKFTAIELYWEITSFRQE